MQKKQNKEEKSIECATIQILKQWDLMSAYTEITTVRELNRIAQEHKNTTEISLDTETTGLDTITAKCLGYSFSFEPHVAYWVPIKVDPQLKALNRLVKGKTVIFFNAGYDLAIIEKYGVKIPDKKVRDVMIACFFRDISGYHRAAGLKAQAQTILSLPTVELKNIIIANTGAKKLKDDEIDFTLLELWQQRVYGCQDADITMQLWQEKSIQDAVKMMPEIWELEHQVIRPVMEMYKHGVGVDLKKVAESDALLAHECKKCREKVEQIAFRECETITNDDGNVTFINPEFARLTKKKGLNLGSFRQKQMLLFDELDLPRTYRIASGWCTGQRALAGIEDSHEIIPLIMRYAKMNARRNSYTKKIPRLINVVTGRIHPSLWQTGTKSGRFSCSNPNMQGISLDQEENDPAKIREAFVPAKGNVMTAADYSQIELRISASLSHESLWYDAYCAGNIDVHQQTAAEIYKTPFEEVTEAQRKIAKVINFSILTGIGEYALSARNKRTIPTREAARKLIDGWFNAVPKLAIWLDSIKKQAHRQKEMRTFFGRIRPFPEINNPKPDTIAQFIENVRSADWTHGMDEETLKKRAYEALISSYERKAVSHIIQGTAADLMKIALVRVRRAIRKEKMPVKMILTVHDELLFEHSPKIINEFHPLLKEAMEFKKLADGWVPLTIDIGYGKSWAEAH